MSQGFELKYKKMRENDPTHQQASSEEDAKAYEQFYNEESHARNISFVWPDGKRKFLSYNYLVSGEYLPEDSTLILTFTTQAFILKGVNLKNLFYEVMNHAVKQVIWVSERYNLIGEDEKFVVNEIKLKK